MLGFVLTGLFRFVFFFDGNASLGVGSDTLLIRFDSFLVDPESSTRDHRQHQYGRRQQSLFHPLQTPLAGIAFVPCCRQS
ncbi:MAG: hypothetical protein VX304_14405 [Planctomycetota bacterium]|nr:hypothetical protein [Planctomycetota bacterium]